MYKKITKCFAPATTRLLLCGAVIGGGAFLEQLVDPPMAVAKDAVEVGPYEPKDEDDNRVGIVCSVPISCKK